MEKQRRYVLQVGLIVGIALLGNSPGFASDRTHSRFFPRIDYCWEFELAGDEPEIGILKLRFKPLGPGNYLVSGSLIEDGEPFPIHGNAISDGSEVQISTLVSGFVEADGNVFLGNGIVTTVLDAKTKDGRFRGFEQGIDRLTNTPITGYFEGTAYFKSIGRRCER